MSEHCLSEDFGVPRFHHHHGTREVREVGRGFKHEGDCGFVGGPAGVVYVEINFIVLALGRDVLALLPHKEAMQLEELADDGFANGHWVS